MTCAPLPMAASMAASASSPGRMLLKTCTSTRSASMASRYWRPRSWALAQSLSSGVRSLMKATFRWLGNNMALKSLPSSPGVSFSACSSSWSAAGAVLTAMGWEWARTLMSGQRAVRFFSSSWLEKVLRVSKGYTRSQTSMASGTVRGSSQPPSFL